MTVIRIRIAWSRRKQEKKSDKKTKNKHREINSRRRNDFAISPDPYVFTVAVVSRLTITFNNDNSVAIGIATINQN